VTEPKVVDIEIILPIKLASCLAGRILSCLASDSLDLTTEIFLAGTENFPRAKSI